MKKTFFLLTVSISLFFISCKSKTDTSAGSEVISDISALSSDSETMPAFKKYGIKSGIVTFDIDMMGLKQKKVLYFDDFGMKEVEEEYSGESIKKITLCNGKERYSIVPEDKTAFSTGSCYRGIAYRYAWDEIAEEDQNTKAKKLQNMNVAGKDCESFSYDIEGSPSVYAGWNSICLYQKTSTSMGDVVMKAITVKENPEIPDLKFQVPEGYKIQSSGF